VCSRLCSPQAESGQEAHKKDEGANTNHVFSLCYSKDVTHKMDCLPTMERDERIVSFVVRRFDPCDQFECRQTILNGLAEHFGFIDESRNPDLDDIEKAYLAAGSDFYVAECEGHIIGTAGLLLEPGRARIVRMSVAKSHRKRGVATALLDKCILVAKDRGLPEIVAFTEPQWPDAVGFYTACGFKQFGGDDEDIHLRLPLHDD
jgi:N-acetylglutamate synthase-like GNAT family acetyltransferase